MSPEVYFGALLLILGIAIGFFGAVCTFMNVVRNLHANHFIDDRALKMLKAARTPTRSSDRATP